MFPSDTKRIAVVERHGSSKSYHHTNTRQLQQDLRVSDLYKLDNSVDKYKFYF